MQRKLIAFTGKKGHGKDTAAQPLILRNYKHTNFAHPLKHVCATVFGLSRAEMNDPALKEKVLERWPHQSPRELMQLVGTDLFRQRWPEVWIRAWENLIGPPDQPVVCTDCRFLNEAGAVHRMGGTIIRIVNPRIEAGDTHQSEMEMDRISADYVVLNDGNILDLQNQIEELLDL